MATTVYKSTDPSAPVLTGQVGSLITLLDAVLVNGYGAKAAAGWTKPFTGTNLAVYRMATANATGSYINVDDNAQGSSAGAREARLRGALTASQANSGTAVTGMTEPTPTTGVGASGVSVLKSATADATARPWKIFADDKSFHLFTLPGNLNGWSGTYAGDYESTKSGDAYRFALIGREAEHVPNGDITLDTRERYGELQTTPATGNAGHFVMRNWTAAAAGQVATTVGKHCGDNVKRNLIPYPDPFTGGAYLARVWLHEDCGTFGIPRGQLRGLWDWLHTPWSSVNDGDTFSGTGALAGKTFEMVKPLALTNVALTSMSCAVIETSTWGNTP